MTQTSRVALVVKTHLPMQEMQQMQGLIPGSERSPGEGNEDPLQYSCLRNPMDRGAQRATVHRVTKSQTQLKRLSTHALWSSLALGRLGMLILSKDIVYYFNNSVSSAYCL